MPSAEELEQYLDGIASECARLGFTEDETERMKEMETAKFHGEEDADVD